MVAPHLTELSHKINCLQQTLYYSETVATIMCRKPSRYVDLQAPRSRPKLLRTEPLHVVAPSPSMDEVKQRAYSQGYHKGEFVGKEAGARETKAKVQSAMNFVTAVSGYIICLSSRPFFFFLPSNVKNLYVIFQNSILISGYPYMHTHLLFYQWLLVGRICGQNCPSLESCGG